MELKPLPKLLQEAGKESARELSMVECVRLHYTEGRRLTPAQEDYRKRMETAHAAMLEHETRANIVEILKERFGIKTTQAYKVCTDAETLYGDVAKHTREGQRYLLIEQLKKKAKELDEKGDDELYLKCQDQIAKLSGAYDHSPKTNKTKMLLPKTVIFTTDSAALEMQRQEEEAEQEYTDYDEV